MRIIVVALVILVFASPSFAGGILMMGGGVPAAAGSCTTYADDVDATGAASTLSADFGSGANRQGQSFQVATNGMTVHSICVSIYGKDAGSCNVTLRYGNDITFAAEYKNVVENHTFVNSQMDLVCFTLQDTTVLSTGTTYYWQITGEAGCAVLAQIASMGSNSYASGIIYWTTAAGLDLTGHDDSGDDASFKVRRCTN